MARIATVCAMLAEDHCYGILAVLEKGKVGEAYNLSGHNERNNLYIVKTTIVKELGKPESLITFVADRHGHDQRYAIDPAKAMKDLGWAPTTTFEQGIKMTIEWYKNNMWWVDECTSGAYLEYYEKMYKDRKIITASNLAGFLITNYRRSKRKSLAYFLVQNNALFILNIP